MTAAAAAAAVHRRLVDLVYPSSLQVSPAGTALVVVAPTDPGSSPTVQIVPLGEGGPSRSWDLGREVTLVRWTADGAGLWVVSMAGDEPGALGRYDAASGALGAETTLPGAIEDLQVIDQDTVLVRLADPGSDRDGMHLGLRVSHESEPRVDVPNQAWRRLVLVTSTQEGLRGRDLDLAGWTVWDVDVRDGLVAVVASRNPLPAGYYRPSLLTARLSDGELAEVTEVCRSSRQLARPCVAADLSAVFVLEGLSIVSGRVRRVDLATGDHQVLPDLDDVTDLGVLDNERLWFTGWHRTGVQVGTVTAPSGPSPKVERWTAEGTMTGDAGQPSLTLTPGTERAYAVWEDPSQPPEVVELRLDRSERRVVTTFNDGLSDLIDLVRTETVRWESVDGTEVEGLLLRPAGDSGRLPLVTLLHGGPTWLWSAAFAPAESNHLALALASAGAAVLLPNPRGSSGRGQDYARAILGRMSSIDLDDVLSGAEHLVRSGVADVERHAVMGLSYGGYLTAIAASRSSRFKAAVVMSGVADWLSFVTTSAIGGGYDCTYHPDDDIRRSSGREKLAARSPVYDERPQRTPTLIVHGSEDRITPLSQAEQLYRVRAALGISTALVVYPGEGHELVDPDHRIDACGRVLSWLTQHGVLS